MDEAMKLKSKIARVARGLAILAIYSGAEVQAEHDRILAGAEEDVCESDRERLTALGWTWNAFEACWSIYT